MTCSTASLGLMPSCFLWNLPNQMVGSSVSFRLICIGLSSGDNELMMGSTGPIVMDFLAELLQPRDFWQPLSLSCLIWIPGPFLPIINTPKKTNMFVVRLPSCMLQAIWGSLDLWIVIPFLCFMHGSSNSLIIALLIPCWLATALWMPTLSLRRYWPRRVCLQPLLLPEPQLPFRSLDFKQFNKPYSKPMPGNH